MAGSPHSSGRPADAGSRALPLLLESASPAHSQGKPDVRNKGTAFPASWPPPQDPPQLPAPSLKNRASALEHGQGQRKQRGVFVSGHSLLAELRRQPHLCSAGHTGCRRLSLEGSSLVLSPQVPGRGPGRAKPGEWPCSEGLDRAVCSPRDEAALLLLEPPKHDSSFWTLAPDGSSSEH